MIVIAAFAALAIQPMGWTWTLYEGEGPLVLANEIPDTPELRATLECEAGSGIAHIAVYDTAMTAGFATVKSGAASAQAQAEAGRGGKMDVAIPIDHPVFSSFVAAGDLSLAVGDQSQSIAVQRPHLAKLRRFAELCGA